MKNLRFIFALFAVLSLVFTSCSKDDVTDSEAETQSIGNPSLEKTTEAFLQFIDENHFTEVELNENYISKINQIKEKLTGKKAYFTLEEALKTKAALHDLFSNNDLLLALNHDKLPNDAKLLNLSVEIKKTLTKKLQQATSNKP